MLCSLRNTILKHALCDIKSEKYMLNLGDSNSIVLEYTLLQILTDVPMIHRTEISDQGVRN